MTPERYERIRRVLDRRQPDLTVLMEFVHKPHNFSAILRTCDAVGVFEAHAVSPEGEVPVHRDTSGGSGKWVRVRVHRDPDGALAHLRERGFRIVAAHPGAGAVDFREVDYTLPTALVLGAEKEGVRPGTVAAADSLVVIPMLGMVPSLNVSVAAAVILYEAERQRARAGLYDAPRLDPETYRRTLFEWGYPRIAEHCRREGLPYPRLGPSGELLDPVPGVPSNPPPPLEAEGRPGTRAEDGEAPGLEAGAGEREEA